MQGASDEITRRLLEWEGVTSAPHRFGGIEFRVGRRELGHLHGDRIADIPFTRRERDELIAAGRVREHHVLPHSGWATKSLETTADVADTIALLRTRYERARSKQAPAPAENETA
jgi:hypothetical protein